MNAASGGSERGLLVLGVVMTALTIVAGRSACDSDKVGPASLPFSAELLRAIQGYEDWTRPTDRYLVAPLMCDTPPPVRSAALSQALDSSPHGRKLYYLHVKMLWNVDSAHPAYGEVPIDPQAIGQVIVKKSFLAEVVDFDAVTKPAGAPVWYLDPDGRQTTVAGHAIDEQAKTAYRAGEARELFVMMKLDPSTPDTDKGWVYGVLSPDGKQVLNSGRIESCLGCHLDAPHDRLFGLK